MLPNYILRQLYYTMVQPYMCTCIKNYCMILFCFVYN